MSLYKDSVKTLTVTQARKNLSHWLRLAKAGEEIGIVDGADIVALRPVRVTAVDYMESEYGLTRAEADAAAGRILSEAAEARRRGRLVTLEEAIAHAPRSAHPKGRGRTQSSRAS